MILHGIEYQRPTSLNMRILADHVTYSFLAFMKSIFLFCLGCYCGGYSQNGRSNLSSFVLAYYQFYVDLPISFRVASLALYDCPSASEVTLKDMGKIRHYWTTTGPWFNIKTSSYHYRKSHCGDKTVVRSSYLRNGISYTGKMVSLYWISPQNVTKHAVSAYFFGVYCIQKCLIVLGMCVTVYVASNIHYCPIWMLILIMWWPTLSSVCSTHCLSICTICTWVV